MNTPLHAFDEDLLISRALDGTASPPDWQALEQAARTDPAVWQRMAGTLQAQTTLRDGLSDVLAAAEQVELPVPQVPVLAGPGAKRRHWVLWAGWATAAAVALAWGGAQAFGTHAAGRVPAVPAGDDGLVAANAPAQIPTEAAPELRPGAPPGYEYLGELPAFMLGEQLAEDGSGRDIIYMRPVLERVRVDQMYRVGRNDLGQPVAVPVSTGPVIPRPPL